MIVLDASIVVERLTGGPLARAVREDPALRRDSLIVPHLLDMEVVSAICGMTAGRRMDAHRADRILSGLAMMPAERYSHVPLLPRIWELRRNFTAYDAAYIALAEATGAILYTADEKLSKGHRARVVLFRG